MTRGDALVLSRVCEHANQLPLLFAQCPKLTTVAASPSALQVTGMARQMVINYGMSDIGPWSLLDPSAQSGDVVMRMMARNSMSENLQQRIDDAVKKIAEEAYEVALRHIRENRWVDSAVCVVCRGVAVSCAVCSFVWPWKGMRSSFCPRSHTTTQHILALARAGQWLIVPQFCWLTPPIPLSHTLSLAPSLSCPPFHSQGGH